MIGKYSFVPRNIAIDALCIGVEQELRGIAPVALLRRPWAMHAEAVALPRFHAREIAMPAVAGDFRQCDTRFAACFIEEAQLDALGHL